MRRCRFADATASLSPYSQMSSKLTNYTKCVNFHKFFHSAISSLSLRMKFHITKGQVRCLICILVIVLLLKVFFTQNGVSNSEAQEELKSLETFTFRLSTSQNFKIESTCEIVIAVILCEDLTEIENVDNRGFVAKNFQRQLTQLTVLLKSIVMLAKYSQVEPPAMGAKNDCIKVLILSDTKEHYDALVKIIYDEEEWSEDFLKFLKFAHYPVKYPTGTNWMKSLFRPCATLRLFLPDILPPMYKQIIYLDTDIIFVRPVMDLWKEFELFSSETIGAMSPCLNHYGSKANKTPFYGTSGLNAGIMLMNLTRMRDTLWTSKIRVVAEIYQKKIKLADQDMLNIYFHFFPEQINIFSCDWNFRPWNCKSNSSCREVNLYKTLSALHGNALSFTNEGPEPWFYAIFQQYIHTKLNSEFSLEKHVSSLRRVLESDNWNYDSRTTNCMAYAGLTQIFLNSFQPFLS